MVLDEHRVTAYHRIGALRVRKGMADNIPHFVIGPQFVFSYKFVFIAYFRLGYVQLRLVRITP